MVANPPAGLLSDSSSRVSFIFIKCMYLRGVCLGFRVHMKGQMKGHTWGCLEEIALDLGEAQGNAPQHMKGDAVFSFGNSPRTQGTPGERTKGHTSGFSEQFPLELGWWTGGHKEAHEGSHMGCFE